MTKRELINSGRMLSVEDAQNRIEGFTPHFDCTDVFLYINGEYIQTLKTGEFLYKNERFAKLDLAEEKMWKELHN